MLNDSWSLNSVAVDCRLAMNVGADDCERATKDLAKRCLAKFDEANSSPDVRVFSLSIILSQISNGNSAMLAYLPEMCRRLKDCSDLMLSVSGTETHDFHCQVINAASIIFKSSLTNLVDGCCDPLVHCLVQLVACHDIEVASLACEFWAQYCATPISTASVRRRWMTVFEPQLPRLIEALLDQMIFREHIERCTLEGVCQRAVAALKSITRKYPANLICATCVPLMQTRIESDSWPVKEAAIRALPVFALSTGQL